MGSLFRQEAEGPFQKDRAEVLIQNFGLPLPGCTRLNRYFPEGHLIALLCYKDQYKIPVRLPDQGLLGNGQCLSLTGNNGGLHIHIVHKELPVFGTNTCKTLHGSGISGNRFSNMTQGGGEFLLALHRGKELHLLTNSKVCNGCFKYLQF